MKRHIKIGNRIIGDDQPAFLVAEISANHRQSLDEAKALVHAAKKSGADAIKVQTYTPDTMTINCDSDYFLHPEDSLWAGRSLYELYQEAYMPWEWQPELQKLAEEIGLEFFSTAYDSTSVEFLEEINIPAFKIASFEIVDLPLIKKIAATGKPMIIATGMADLNEIEKAVATARDNGADQIALLKCTSAYPSDPKEMNLKTMAHMAETFRLPCGLSDHTTGGTCAIAAVSLGACIIEKHFTLSKNNKSPDAAFSMEPDSFSAMASQIRIVEKALGQASYGPVQTEAEGLKFRRSLFVVKDIPGGESLTHENIRAIRPGFGLNPEYFEKVIGKRAKTALKAGTPLIWEVIR